MSSYYIPSIKDLRHGDDIQWKWADESDWKDETYDASIIFNSKDGNEDNDMPISFALYIANSRSLSTTPLNIRVKYLDKSDIETLGFGASNNRKMLPKHSSFVKHYKKIGTKEKPDGYHRCCEILFQTVKNHKWDIVPNIIIWYGSFNSYGGQTKFNGNIKNKSELIKLLKQLNIK